MNENIYDIDFKKLVRWQVPKQLRKKFWLTWLGVLITPVATLYNQFLSYRKAKLYDLMITPQVCYLETMLNDRWDLTLRRIYIDDAVEHSPVYIYQDVEDKAVPLYRQWENMPLFLYTDAEGGDYADDFVVYVPLAVDFDTVEMRRVIMKKRLPGMRFSIQTY